MKIDAHHHFWKYDPPQYAWIDDSMTAIRRDFLPDDLRHEIAKVGIHGVVSVQARQTLEETDWLLDLADEYDFVHGVVGWVPLAGGDVREYLDRLSARPRLKGVRHIVQAEPDEFILRNDFNAGVGLLAAYHLAYDILIYERQLPQAVEFVDRHPNQVFVLDHLAKPRAKEDAVEPWRANIRRIAERENVFCKLSGLVTEADWKGWTEGQLSVYLGTVIDAFGPRRVMFGTDWPVCLLAASYTEVLGVAKELTAGLSDAERAAVFDTTAREIYNL